MIDMPSEDLCFRSALFAKPNDVRYEIGVLVTSNPMGQQEHIITELICAIAFLLDLGGDPVLNRYVGVHFSCYVTIN